MSNSAGDTLVYTQSNEMESDRGIMLKKEWLNILDQSNGSYASSQSIIETTVLANSSKFMNYREGYIVIPLIITANNTAVGASGTGFPIAAPATQATSCDYSFGLKNSYLSLIHSVSVDLNGKNIIQQTAYQSLYNNFKLLTSLSWNDVITQGPTIGFYPDNPLAFTYNATAASDGTGICNNDISLSKPYYATAYNNYDTTNEGLLKRIQYINYDATGSTGPNQIGESFSTLQTATYANDLYRSQIITKQNGSASLASVFQIQVLAIVRLRHLHHFFEVIPLCKGVQLRIILNLNQTVTRVTNATGPVYSATNTYLAFNGVNPLMMSSGRIGVAPTTTVVGLGVNPNYSAIPSANDGTFDISLYVGNECLNTAQSAFSGVTKSSLPTHVQLYVPAYEMNPRVEALYITTNPNKTIIYNDIYQYKIKNVSGGASFNELITNGIKGIKSVLLIPYFTSSFAGGVPFQNIFSTDLPSPLCGISNYQVQLSGQNMSYSMVRYSFEHFNNNLYGAGAVNAGLTDGLTSGLINELGFQIGQCYYYIDCSRGLPIETEIPRSVVISGTNKSVLSTDYYIYIEYTTSVGVNVQTGMIVS